MYQPVNLCSFKRHSWPKWQPCQRVSCFKTCIYWGASKTSIFQLLYVVNFLNTFIFWELNVICNQYTRSLWCLKMKQGCPVWFQRGGGQNCPIGHIQDVLRSDFSTILTRLTKIYWNHWNMFWNSPDCVQFEANVNVNDFFANSESPGVKMKAESV